MTENLEGSVWTIPRDGNQVTVGDEDLTQEEIRMLRASTLINEMALGPVLQDQQELQDQLKIVEEELIKRHERIRHLSEKDNKSFAILSRMTQDYFSGTLPADALSKEQLDEIENIYVRTLPYVTLEPDDEVRMRDIIRRVADKEFEKGEFGSKEAAREFYGLGSDNELEE